MSQPFASGGQSIRVSASTSVPPKNTQDWSPLGWTGWISLQSKGLSRVFSNTTVQKHKFFGAQLSSQSNSHIHTWPLDSTREGESWNPSWGLILVTWPMQKALIPWLGCHVGVQAVRSVCGDEPAFAGVVWLGFRVSFSSDLPGQVAPCLSLPSAASSCFSATASPRWSAGSACSAGPALPPGTRWMWSQWSCIPPTRGQLLSALPLGLAWAPLARSQPSPRSSTAAVLVFLEFDGPNVSWAVEAWVCPEAGIGLGLGRLRLDRVGWMARCKGPGQTLSRREEPGPNLCMCHPKGGENRAASGTWRRQEELDRQSVEQK